MRSLPLSPSEATYTRVAEVHNSDVVVASEAVEGRLLAPAIPEEELQECP